MAKHEENIVVHELRKVLADTYNLYFKTHSYHWNVEGMHFATLHTLFEQQYTEMWTAIDELAERLRALGAYAPINYQNMTEGSNIKPDNSVPSAEEMVKNLAHGHQMLVKTLHQAIQMATTHEDEVTSDVFLSRLNVHEKTLWMLKSLSK